MYKVVNINNIFALGYRCNNDEFLIKFLKIRKYSSPFSYMVIDINSALDFIDNKFLNYTNMNYIANGNDTYKFNKRDWTCNHVHTCSVIENEHVDILDMDRVCIWNHHDLRDNNVINSINRRSSHLLECLHNKSDTTLLFYIEKIQKYEREKESYFDINRLDKYDCKFLIFIPLLDFNADPFIFYDNSNIRIIYFNSDLALWGTDINSHTDEWSKLEVLVNKLYHFNIESRNDN